MADRSESDPFDEHLRQWADGGLEDAALSSLFGRDYRFPQIDVVTLGNSLKGFRLPLAEGQTLDWLAVAVRRALAAVTPDAEAMPSSYQGNKKTRDNILALANRANALLSDIEALPDNEAETIMAALNDETWARYQVAKVYLKLLAATFEMIGGSIKIENRKWRAVAKRELRIRQAHSLSPIYERAFGRGATVNDWQEAKDMGPWPDFFARILKLATNDSMTSSQLRSVLKEGRDRHQSQPIRFPRGVISDESADSRP